MTAPQRFARLLIGRVIDGAFHSPDCPFCHEAHRHGAGILGSRVPHCTGRTASAYASSFPQYVLVDRGTQEAKDPREHALRVLDRDARRFAHRTGYPWRGTFLIAFAQWHADPENRTGFSWRCDPEIGNDGFPVSVKFTRKAHRNEAESIWFPHHTATWRADGKHEALPMPPAVRDEEYCALYDRVLFASHWFRRLEAAKCRTMEQDAAFRAADPEPEQLIAEHISQIVLGLKKMPPVCAI